MAMKSESKIFILGSSGFAHEIKDYFLEYYRAKRPKGQIADLYVNHVGLHEPEFYFVGPDGMSVKEYHAALNASLSKPTFSIMGSGKCSVKIKMLEEIRGHIISMVHPTSHVISAKIGSGSIIAPGSVVAPRAVVGDHCLVNYNATIGHDAIVGDLSVVSPNASIGGSCVLGRGVHIGSNASVREGLKIGEGATVGMGAVVIKDVPSGVTVVGVPARTLIKEN
tara:strand:- start:65246 stop:65914 length:669 start_codon:yes stop_codon:yes gene_type:complete